MRSLTVLLSILLLGGCIYDVPLVEKAEVPVDPALTGIWQMIPDEGTLEDPDDRLVILPFSKTEYVAISGQSDAALYFRAYPVRLDGMELIQLEWLQVEPGGDERYHVCRYTLENGVLTVETLNDDVVGRRITDSKALCKTLLVNRDDPELFEDAARYQKLED